ncbi:MAG: oxidoreductase [Planctomycetes bacterium]|nr:oxidoreductase [Planctomycetota bacterium]
MEFLVTGIAVQILGGIGAVALSRLPRVATIIGAGATITGALLGMPSALGVLTSGQLESLQIPWELPNHLREFQVEVDSLTAVFLVPILGLTILATIYGANYLSGFSARKSLGTPWFFFNLFVAGMVLVVIARTVFLFFVAWELMSLAAYFLVTFEHEREEVRRAGWIYLVTTQLGVAFLLSAFLVLGYHAESLDFVTFQPARALSAAGGAGAVFVLALIGFGAKAGLVPFHVWLPEAHPAAPSHVSALMSGVMIKVGLYGLLRILTFLGPSEPWWGLLLATMGMLTALVGISMALQQRDIKRVLAYSSIENIGLICLSLGLGLWGQATNKPIVAGLGMAGGLLHIWNHALMKGLMFLSAGSILHGTGTRDMERLGGLTKRMPWTGTFMTLGALAMAALPPLNGFTSKWLMYLALMQGGLNGYLGLTALLAVGLLAMVGALAAITYVRLVGIALLGSPRSEEAEHAHESSPWMLGPIGVLIMLCVTMAVVPYLGLDLLSGCLAQLQSDPAKMSLELPKDTLASLGWFNAWLLAAIGLGAVLLMVLTRKTGSAVGPTWGCGFAAPTVRIQYTGLSFSEMLAEHLLPRFLRPRRERKAPTGVFPSPSEFSAQSPDPLTEKVYAPFFTRWARWFSDLRILQQGQVNIYLAYIVLTTVLALAWMTYRTWPGGTR